MSNSNTDDFDTTDFDTTDPDFNSREWSDVPVRFRPISADDRAWRREIEELLAQEAAKAPHLAPWLKKGEADWPALVYLGWESRGPWRREQRASAAEVAGVLVELAILRHSAAERRAQEEAKAAAKAERAAARQATREAREAERAAKRAERATRATQRRAPLDTSKPPSTPIDTGAAR